MILKQKRTSIAYRCPECGTIVKSVVGIFSLTADMIKLKCPCGGSNLDIIYTKDKKVRITVPCFICPGTHSFLISSTVFFERDIFTLACSYSGIDICFIGDSEKIDEAVLNSENELLGLMGEAGVDASQLRGHEDRLTDPQVLEIVMYVIKEMEEEGNIRCNCEDKGDYEVQIGNDSVFIVCKRCGAEAVLPANSISSAHAFLNADNITLT